MGITISFLGIKKWEPDIFIGFSPALHLQCGFFTACHYTDIDAMAILVDILSRAQITFGDFAKGNLIPFRMYEQKQKHYFSNENKTFFLWVLSSFWTTVTINFIKISNLNNITAAIICMYKIEHRMQICQRNPNTAERTYF